MSRSLEELKAQVDQLKYTRYPVEGPEGSVIASVGASAHEKALIALVAELIGHLEFLPDHAHHMTSGNSLRTEGPEDMR